VCQSGALRYNNNYYFTKQLVLSLLTALTRAVCRCALQVLTSEQVQGDALYRKRALVFPETGCALDDLAVVRAATV
jgi:hypothetical protein